MGKRRRSALAPGQLMASLGLHSLGGGPSDLPGEPPAANHSSAPEASSGLLPVSQVGLNINFKGLNGQNMQ